MWPQSVIIVYPPVTALLILLSVRWTNEQSINSGKCSSILFQRKYTFALPVAVLSEVNVNPGNKQTRMASSLSRIIITIIIIIIIINYCGSSSRLVVVVVVVVHCTVDDAHQIIHFAKNRKCENDHQSPKKSIALTLTLACCSIERKWDGKITKIWYDNEIRWIRITVWNGGDL